MALTPTKIGTLWVPCDERTGLPWNPETAFAGQKPCQAAILAGHVGAPKEIWVEPISSVAHPTLEKFKYHRVWAVKNAHTARPVFWLQDPDGKHLELSYNYYMVVSPYDVESAKRGDPGRFVATGDQKGA